MMENQDTTDSTVEEAEASGAGTGLCVSESDYGEGKLTCSNLVDRTENFTSQEVDLSVNISGVFTNKLWVSVGAAGSNIHEATKNSHTISYGSI